MKHDARMHRPALDICQHHYRLMRAALAVLILLAAVVPPAALRAAGAATVREVLVEGNQALPTEQIMTHVRTRAGAVLDESMIADDARRLVVTPGVYDVTWRVIAVGDEVDVVFNVIESARITAVEIVGNKNLDSETLSAEIQFEPGDFLDHYLVNSAAESLERLYKSKGYYFAEVTVNRSLLASERRVVFIVIEGPRTRIKKVKFDGNEAIGDTKLKSKVSTKAYMPIFVRGEIDDDKLRQDTESLAAYYHDEAYLDARVFARKEFNDDQSKAEITYVIEEGLRYETAAIRFEGNAVFTDEQLSTELGLEVGQHFTDERRTRARQSVERRYGKLGYIYCRVTVAREFLEEPGQVIAVIKVDEGASYDLGQVIIHGNTETKDKVVRRTFDRYGFSPGAVYDTDAAKRARRRLGGSGLFENVEVRPIGDEPAERDALVEVSEAMTGMILFGVGVNTNEGLVGQFQIAQRNFDIGKPPKSLKEMFTGKSFVGAGQSLELNVQPGAEVTRGNVRFREPYLFDQPYYLDVDLYLFQRDRESYEEKRRGGRVTLGRRFDNDWSVDIAFRTEQIKVDDIELDAPMDVWDVRGNNFLTSVRGGVGFDNTDRAFMPTEGHKLRFSWEQVGALGGDFDYPALLGRAVAFHTLYEDITERRTVIGGRIEGRYICGEAPTFERYYAGGISTLRGFEYRGVSPRAGAQEDPIGSEWLFLAGAEIRHPLIEETVYGRLFCDSGTVETGTYRVAVGFGFDIVVPQLFQMIPMQFNFGFPVQKADEDESELFSFTFGMSF